MSKNQHKTIPPDSIINAFTVLSGPEIEIKWGRKVYLYELRCECGNVKKLPSYKFANGETLSCGCRNRPFQPGNTPANKGFRKPKPFKRLSKIWSSLKQRCTNPNDSSWHYYGGRGITVCPEWLESFEAFRDWALANGYAPNLEIDRIDNDGGYSPQNCRWVTHAVNMRNRRGWAKGQPSV